MLKRQWLVAGMVAGVMLGMIQMIYEAVAGLGFWSPVVLIAATIMRDLQKVGTHVPAAPLPIILGLMGHMMNAVILGMLFAMMVRGVRSRGSLTMAGMAYGLIVFGVMWFLILPLVDPVMKELSGIAFAFAHLMWGGTLGFFLGAQSGKGSASP